MPNYNDPSGYASWFVNPGEDPNQSAFAPWNLNPGLGDSRDSYLANMNNNAPATAAAPRASGDATNPGQLTLTKDGQTRVMPAANPADISALVQQGWIPLNEHGQPYRVIPYMGGQMFVDATTGQGLPLNGILGEALTPEQQAAMPGFNQLLDFINSTGDGGGGGTSTGSGSNLGTGGLNNFDDLMNLAPIPSIPQENLGEMPTMPSEFTPEFIKNYWKQTGDVEGEMNGIYQLLHLPTMNAAQLDTSAIPQAQNSDALNFLLSGQGFQPDVLDRMRAGVMDNAADAGRSARGSARLMGEQAGLSGSPAVMALEAQANRNQGAATQQGLNQVEIQNAQEGLTNLRGGAAMANQNALQQAAAIFAGMQQNVSNVQQANSTNTENENTRQMAAGNAQAGVVSTAGANLNSASTQMAQAAGSQNASNAANWGLNQAQLNRQANIYNTGTKENRYGQAFQGLLSLINGANPSSYNVSGASLGTTPNLGYANMFQNFGNQLLGAAR